MNEDVIDKDRIIEAVRRDQHYQDSYDLFCQFHPELETKLQLAAHENDHKKLLESTHMLKSRLLFLNCDILAERVSQLETLTQADESVPEDKEPNVEHVALVEKLLQQIQVALVEIRVIIEANS